MLLNGLVEAGCWTGMSKISSHEEKEKAGKNTRSVCCCFPKLKTE